MNNKVSILSKFPMQNWEQMDKFIAATHGERHVLRNRPLFDWFFLRNGNAEEANVIVAYEGDKLISLLGYIPTNFRCDEEIVAGAWMAHWMTMPGHRFGIGALLMKKIIEMFPVVAGQGASLMNQAIVTKMKFKFLEKIPKVIFVFNCNKIEQVFGHKVVHHRPGEIDLAGLPHEIAKMFSENFRPDWRNYPSMKFGTLRDENYLNERYFNFPFFDYKVFLEGPAVSPTVCVTRIIDTNEGVRVGRVLDFFSPETETGRRQSFSLLNKCLYLFKKTGCDYVDFYCTAAPYLDMFLEVGFIKDEDGSLPSLLDPIDRSRKFQNMELWGAPLLKQKYPDFENGFIVMRADGDQDRPNESYRGPIR
jgi:hypothetical protein